MKKKEEWHDIATVELNNKSRKGLYYRVRIKGKTRYYKADKPIEFIQDWIKERQGFRPEIKGAEVRKRFNIYSKEKKFPIQTKIPVTKKREKKYEPKEEKKKQVPKKKLSRKERREIRFLSKAYELPTFVIQPKVNEVQFLNSLGIKKKSQKSYDAAMKSIKENLSYRIIFSGVDTHNRYEGELANAFIQGKTFQEIQREVGTLLLSKIMRTSEPEAYLKNHLENMRRYTSSMTFNTDKGKVLGITIIAEYRK